MSHQLEEGLIGEGFLVNRPPGRVDSLSDNESLTAWIKTWSPDLESIVQSHSVRSFVFADYEDGKGIDFLLRFEPQVEQLHVRTAPSIDLSVISRLHHMQRLTIEARTKEHGSNIEQVDFAQLARLRSCAIQDAVSIGNVATCPNLESLALTWVPLSDVHPLLTLQRLCTLELHDVPLRSLHFIDQVTSLKSLTLSDLSLRSLQELERSSITELSLQYVRGIRSISPLLGIPLRKLCIVGCKTIDDLEAIGRIRSLEELRLAGGEMESVRFVRELTNLRLFACSKKIIDGNLEILLELPRLAEVVIHPDLRRYSPRASDLKRMLADRHS